MSAEESFLDRAENLLARLERLLPAGPQSDVDWATSYAFRWRHGGHGSIEPVRHTTDIRLDDLQCIERQKGQIDTNTRQFLRGLPANNVLLWGPRGTGKSSVIKALLNTYAPQGLRIIEVQRAYLSELPAIVDLVYDRPERFIVFCDDLSFESNDIGYKSIKVILDGSISSTPDNMLIYATSNRRHLLPERHSDNDSTRITDTEIHYGEAVEERISLSERFGLWIAFHPFNQEDFLKIVFYWLSKFDVTDGSETGVRAEALRWALLRGSRSGRAAWQFARDRAGKQGLET